MATASLQRVRPFASSCLLPRCPTRVAILTKSKITQVCAATAADKSQSPSLPTSGILAASAAASLGAWTFAAQRAIADELPAAAVSTIGDIVVDTSASGKGYGLEDFLVTLLFGTVVLLLAVVTGGVSCVSKAPQPRRGYAFERTTRCSGLPPVPPPASQSL